MKNEDIRAAWIASQLKSLPKGLKLLDVGAGEQQYKKHCTHLEYISQDFNAYDPKKLNTGFQMEDWNYGKTDIVSDIVSIPVEANSFDVILCTEVFEHIPDPINAIKEFKRILKPGGKLILTAPFCSSTHFAPFHFYSGFNKFFYEKYLPENSFKIEKLETNGNYFDYLNQEIGRIPFLNKGLTKNKLNFIDKIGLKLAYRTLTKLSAGNINSQEFLNFGFHILATKQS